MGSSSKSRLFQSVYQLVGLSNAYSSTYHRQANGPAERYNRTLQNMLICFVEEHQDSWDKYATFLTYAYNCNVHRTTGTTPFDLILSLQPPPFSLNRSLRYCPEPDSRDRHEFLIALDETIAGAYPRLKKTLACFKKNFDKRVRSTNMNIGPGDYFFIDPTVGSKKRGKLQSQSRTRTWYRKGTIATFTINRKDATEVTNTDRVTRAPRSCNAPAFSPEPAQLNKVTDGPQNTVQKIFKHRMAADDDQFDFLIKWAEYEDPSCTKSNHVPEELISRYFRQLHRPPQGRNAQTSHVTPPLTELMLRDCTTIDPSRTYSVDYSCEATPLTYPP